MLDQKYGHFHLGHPRAYFVFNNKLFTEINLLIFFNNDLFFDFKSAIYYLVGKSLNMNNCQHRNYIKKAASWIYGICNYK